MKAFAQGKAKSLVSNYSIWLFFVVLFVGISLLSPNFLDQTNIMNMMREAVIVGIMAIGVTLVMVSGCFDLSSGAVMCLGAILSMNMNPVGVGGTMLSFVVPILAGAAIGLVNGFLVGYLKMNAFITTLGMQYVILGLTLLYTGGNHVHIGVYSDVYYAVGNGYIGFVPLSVALLLVLVFGAQWLLSFTKFGQRVTTAGANEDAATLSGVRVERARCLTYVLLGVCASIAGVVMASWVKRLEPSSGIGYEFEAITAVVLGGTSLLGGRGNIANSMAGAFIMVMIVNAMILLDISYNYQLMVRGLILIAAVALEVWVRRNKR